MKKILFAIAIVMMMGFTANAQSDGFFHSWDDYEENRISDFKPVIPAVGLINGGAYGNDVNAPLGSGLLVLTALGAGYAMARRRCEE